MTIDYNHSKNRHSITGPQVAIPLLFPKEKPKSMLDVGCGTGTWLKAAREWGIEDILGVDGVEIPTNSLHIPISSFRKQDLNTSWKIGRKFDAAICLEVAEHLEATRGPILVDALTYHADFVVFSAACPGQVGQHHINCQWPGYWQKLFNDQGFACDDSVRWQMWDDERIEPWYRQNLFHAQRDPLTAGKEPRIQPVVHPAMLPLVFPEKDLFKKHVRQIADGCMEWSWYLKAPINAFASKVLKHMRGHSRSQ